MVSVEQFIEGLIVSGLMTRDEVHALLVSLPPDMREPSVRELASELVRRDKLTRYQAGRIASGQHQGLVLGKYVIQDKIGEGGMGEVFRAEHRRMKRPVVVKILPREATQSVPSLRRFQREVEAAAQLSHPNIVTAYDADEEDGIHFLVMEYVEGRPLGDVVSREGPMPVGQAVSCVLQAAYGLQYAHEKGIIHRDIKPNNLLLDDSGTVKILDMGLARFDDGRASVSIADGENLTAEYQIVGTVEYMAPEQVDNSSHADRRSDIYSLGCTLFRLLTNRPPYQGPTLVKTLLAHRLEPIPSLCAERPDVPARLDDIFARMVAKRPEDRYASMDDVIMALEELLDSSEFETAFGDGFARRGDLDISEDGTTIIDGEARREVLEHREQRPATIATAEEDTQVASLVPVSSTPARKARLAIGIDLGTTYSALAALDDLGRPEIVANAEGDKTTPSVVLVDDDEIVVGKEAVKAMATDMDRVAECAKRDMGRQAYHASLGGKRFPPEVLQALVLHKLSCDAARQVGPIRDVVITVPAYFDEVRRKATHDAGYMAGLHVLDIINEPTAAAIAFGYQSGRLLPERDDDEPMRILVYDLGGGTFDVTLMEIGSGEFVTLATDGDMQLGGRDWDQRLLDHVADEFRSRFQLDPRDDPNCRGRLLRDCEDAKRTLAARQKTFVPCEYGGHALKIEVTRRQFEQLTEDLLERTAFTTRQLIAQTRMTWDQIDRVLLVGGATRMPAVSQMLSQLTGKQPDTSVSPDEAVAQGAAIYAGVLLDKIQGKRPRVRVRNVNSHSLGLVATDRRTSRKQVAVLIPRNTPLPAKAKRIFKTLKDKQRSIAVNIVEGESADPQAATHIGKCTVHDLPDLPAGTPIEVRFQYRENGLLRVAVSVAGLDRNVVHEIRRTNNLSTEDLDLWRERITGEKVPSTLPGDEAR